MIARAASLLNPGTMLALLRPETDLSTPEARGRDRHRRIILSAGASVVAKMVTIAASLISVPLTLHYLGPERYGIWIIISSFTVMLSFADMGLGNGILNAVAREHGRDDRSSIRTVVSSGYALLAGLAAVLAIGFVVSYPFVSWYRLFNVNSALARREAGPALAVFLLCFAITIPLSLVQKIQIGLQQGFLSSLWQCLGSVLGLIALLAVIHVEGGLPWLVGALVGIPLIAVALNTASFFIGSLGGDIRPSFAHISREAAVGAARTGILFFALQIVVSFAYGADSIIIAQHAGAVSVPQYAVPERMFSLITMLLGMVMAPLWPAYGEAIVRGDHAWVSTSLKKAVFAATVLSSLASIILVFMGPAIVHLWVGQQIQPTLTLLIGLALWKVVEASSSALAAFMNGAEMLRFQIVTAAISGVGMIALKIFLVQRIGVAGIPWAASIAFIPLAAVPTWFAVYRWLQKAKATPAAPNEMR